MGKIKKPEGVKLVIGMLAKDEKLFDAIEKYLSGKFGKIDYKSAVLLFDQTNYYKEEFGWPLKRKFISFKNLIFPESISRVKTVTNAIENKSSRKEQNSLKRQINIDPGYVSDSKFILATTKDYFHRIYLNNGIYAEVTLKWRDGNFEPFEWTYPDYRTASYITILNSIRNSFMEERKGYAKQ